MANSTFGEFSVGASSDHVNVGYPSFKGKIDEVMVFRSALSRQNVARVFVANVTETNPKISQKQGFKVVVNPVADGNLVVSNEHEPIISVKIYDLQGKICKSTEFNGLHKTNALQISDIKPGLYMVNMKTLSYAGTMKVLVR